jgi:hypothetical protein
MDVIDLVDFDKIFKKHEDHIGKKTCLFAEVRMLE